MSDGETVTIEAVQGDDLYDFDGYRGRATGAELCLDPATRELSCRAASRDTSAVPARQWHGLVIVWTIPALTADAANALMTDVADAAERVCDGWESVWDGRNHVGRLDEEGQDAADEIARAIERREPWDAGDVIEPWDAGDWLGALGGLARQGDELGITADTTDDELGEIVGRVEEDAAADGQRVRGVREHLEHVRAAVAAEHEADDDDADDQSEEVCA